jgi:hypothetical protein
MITSTDPQERNAPKEVPDEPGISVVPTADDLNTTNLVVAVHGIGKQFRYSTIQAVASRFAFYCKSPITQPLGAFHPDKLIPEPDSPELGAYLFHPSKDFEEFQGFAFAESFWAATFFISPLIISTLVVGGSIAMGARIS